MISGSSHPSRTSVNSTTPLGNTYRPPPKDYAAAFGALQTTYGHGAPGIGAGPASGSPLPKPQGGTGIESGTSKKSNKPGSPPRVALATPPGDSVAAETDRSRKTGAVKAAAKKVANAVRAAFRKIFGGGVGTTLRAHIIMLSSTSYPSSSSVNSATQLTAAFRPPPKDYAAAYATLQEKYGPSGYGQRAPETAPQPRESRSTLGITASHGTSSPPENSSDQTMPPSTQSTLREVLSRGIKTMFVSFYRFRLRGKMRQAEAVDQPASD
ncbi:hypothetical protein K438DRAFT_2017447 [Mycena galopus ATCC 62051]|nr:hypothetical protein K438DRAFT_2017447 [Mycena galopus ATCC 62051]